MDMEKLKDIAENAIVGYFEGIDSVVDDIVSKIVDEHKIEDEYKIDYLKTKIRRGILKFDQKDKDKKIGE